MNECMYMYTLYCIYCILWTYGCTYIKNPHIHVMYVYIYIYIHVVNGLRCVQLCKLLLTGLTGLHFPAYQPPFMGGFSWIF